MDITLERIGRTVVVRGPDGRPPGQPVSGKLEDLLTYFERHYDFAAAADGAGGFSLVRRQLYAVDTRTGLLYFPLGLRPRVTTALQTDGHRVRYTGGTLAALNPKAHEPDWDGLMAEFQLYPGQDTCLLRIAGSDGGIINASTGFGKAQPLDAKVYTPSGPKPMGSVRVGDVICHPYNVSGTTSVVAVHPQGVIPIYRVAFADGTVVRCCGNHLWRVRRRGPNTKYQVVSTESLRDRMARTAGADAYMTASKPLQYASQAVDIPPYTLGVLIGDGSLTQATVKWCKPDREILDFVTAELPSGLRVSGDDQEHTIVGDGVLLGGKGNHHLDQDWHPYRVALKKYGLWGKRSEEKFIPPEYLQNSVAVRMELLHGLMDTDGSVYANGLAVEYSTSSPQLAKDFRELVDTLGIDATVVQRPTTHLDSYRIKVKAPNPADMFKSSAKKSKVVQRTKYSEVVKKIRSITPDGEAEAQCITVADADGLYVTDGCIPTHNSVVMRMLCRLYNRAKIHVVTKARTLANEIFADLNPVVPGLGFVGGGKNKTGRVTVYMADSLHHGMGDCDILIADEVHELCAPKYAEKLGMYSKARMFGMSATPTGRSDNRDLVGEAIFGPILYTVSYQEAQAQGRVVPITVEWLRMPTGPSLGGIKFPAAREKIGVWRNDVRNTAIAARARQFSPDEQVLVMVKTIEHAVRLKALMPEFTLAYAKDGMDESRISDYQRQGLLPADEPVMTGARVEQLRTEFAAGKLKKVIANYVWSTGVNFRTLAALIRADAAGSEIRDGQIPGRVCRRVAGVKEAAVMVDCWDEWDPTLLGRARKRKANYAKRGWTQLFQPAAQIAQKGQES